VIAVATIPIAIFANAFRVAGTGIGAHYLGPKAAEGFLHTFSGWLVFVFALSLVFALRHAIARLAPIHGRPGATRDVLATGGAPC
jgi:exosortase/archaeosortase family protein